MDVQLKLLIALHESSMGRRRMMKCHRHHLYTIRRSSHCTIECFYHLELLSITRASLSQIMIECKWSIWRMSTMVVFGDEATKQLPSSFSVATPFA